MLYVEPGDSWEGGYIEPLNGKLRSECRGGQRCALGAPQIRLEGVPSGHLALPEQHCCKCRTAQDLCHKSWAVLWSG